jgi:hypothetical protein
MLMSMIRVQARKAENLFIITIDGITVANRLIIEEWVIQARLCALWLPLHVERFRVRWKSHCENSRRTT